MKVQYSDFSPPGPVYPDRRDLNDEDLLNGMLEVMVAQQEDTLEAYRSKFQNTKKSTKWREVDIQLEMKNFMQDHICKSVIPDRIMIDR